MLENNVDLIKFINVEEEPLMEDMKNWIIITLSVLILCIGIIINFHIYRMLSKRKNAAVIDRLFRANTIFSLFCHPLILIYYVMSSIIFPMSDYIGIAGCILSVHLFDVFTRFYNFCFPVSIALLRYLFVVEHFWVKSKGMTKVANWIIAFTYIIPLFMTISVQYPIVDTIHGSYNRCIGRFDVQFKPLDSDPISPGLRGGSSNYCEDTSKWAFDPDISNFEYPFRVALLSGCKITITIAWIVMLSVPEMILYSATFLHIILHTNGTALSGILNAEVIKKRRQKNSLNIVMTFWTWFAQFITNLIYLSIMKIFYGKNRYYQSLLASLSVSLNFNILPLLYVLLADENFKSAILKKEHSSNDNLLL
jgi:hypothetical protein